MLKKYSSRLLMYDEIPHVKNVLSQHLTPDKIKAHFDKVLSEFSEAPFKNAHAIFVWDIIVYVFRVENYVWYDYIRTKYHCTDNNVYNLFSAILEIEYGIPSYKT